jgi:hypothetical protein
VPPADAASGYEKLRTAVLGAKPAACPGLAILRRRGLAAWIGALGPEPRAEVSNRRPATTHDPTPPANDLTRLIAGILVTLVTEPAHA